MPETTEREVKCELSIFVDTNDAENERYGSVGREDVKSLFGELVENDVKKNRPENVKLLFDSQ